MSQQAIVALKKGLGTVENPVERRERILQEMADDPIVLSGEDLPDPSQMVREDRQR